MLPLNNVNEWSYLNNFNRIIYWAVDLKIITFYMSRDEKLIFLHSSERTRQKSDNLSESNLFVVLSRILKRETKFIMATMICENLNREKFQFHKHKKNII